MELNLTEAASFLIHLRSALEKIVLKCLKPFPENSQNSSISKPLQWLKPCRDSIHSILLTVLPTRKTAALSWQEHDKGIVCNLELHKHCTTVDMKVCCNAYFTGIEFFKKNTLGVISNSDIHIGGLAQKEQCSLALL